MTRDRFDVIGGGRADDEPAHQLAADIMRMHGEVRRERPDDDPPVGSD